MEANHKAFQMLYLLSKTFIFYFSEYYSLLHKRSFSKYNFPFKYVILTFKDVYFLSQRKV